MAGLLASLQAVHAEAAAPPTPAPKVKQDPRDDSSPWGIGSGAEWFNVYPSFTPRLRDAGIRWLRAFYEWAAIQPEPGVWNWQLVDRLIENSRANNLRLTAPFLYFAPWASADGSTRTFPIKDMQYWRDYVGAAVTRYHKDIKYWEVWNEFNGSFAVNATPQIYADLVRETSSTAKSIDPDAKVGMSVANFDLRFLDAAIKAGAAGHFDYICVHPYENMGTLLDDGEVGFLGMAGRLRAMLAANNEKSDMPLWITEIGTMTSVKPDAEKDRVQAEGLAKAYLLALASGFQRIFWFEVRGPDYGGGHDFGIIRPDWTNRPAYDALKTLSTALGQSPKYLGWLDLDQGGYGFLFEGTSKSVLAAWSARGKTHTITFTGPVRITDLAGKTASLRAGEPLTLTGSPVFITNVPQAIVKEARRNKDAPFPWGGDYSEAETVAIKLGESNKEEGLRQLNLNTTIASVSKDETLRRTDFARSDGEGRYVYFQVNPSFAPYGTRNLEITAVARRIAPDKVAGVSLDYESVKGYVSARRYVTLPADRQWHEITWTVKDADFLGGWAWNLRLNANGSPNELEIKEIRVKKPANGARPGPRPGLDKQERSFP